MGINERKEKQKAELKQQILEASAKLFIEQGYEGVSIRKIADIIEYSPTTVYLYFKDKNEILFELHEIGFRKYAEANANLAGIKNPLLRLHKMGENYIQFALENPEFYDLMFLLPAPIEFINQCNDDQWHGGDRALSALKQVIEECMERGIIEKADVNAVAMAVWGMVHGLVTLNIRKRCDKLIAEEEVVPTMFRALNWMVGLLEEKP